MSIAPNVLLQANVATTARTSAASNSLKPADIGRDGASGFSGVYAQQSKDKPAVERDVPAKPNRDKVAADKDKTVAGKDKPSESGKAKADDDKVAESGNSLPAETVAKTSDGSEQDDSSQSQPDPAVAELLPVITDPALDLAAQQAAAQVPVPEVPVEVTSSQQMLPVVAAPAVAQVNQPVAPVVPAVAAEEAFDPAVDPLEGLHALQFALESSGGKRSVAQPAVTQDKSAQTANTADAESAKAQAIVNNLASLGDDAAAGDDATESSDQSFTSVLSSGLKSTDSAQGDTRIDNFAERLAALSQAAQPARPAHVAAPATSPLSQPLAMHQSGWSEGIVERVMYLSSQNLKSAEIKLEPAELGRLDIRVNMAPDQQTSVTFVSAHMGVRDALESQVVRLRESFNQQGLGQVDVNVSDQSQQQAQQQAQEQASRAQRGGGRGISGGDEVLDDAAPEAVAAASQPVQRVIGTSEIDFYA